MNDMSTPSLGFTESIPYSRLLLLVRTGHSDCCALATGAELAARNGAQLLLRAFDDPAEPLPPETATAWLETTLARLQAQGLKASGELIARQPIVDAMLADIEALQPDLVIKELKRETTFRRLFFTPEDSTLARQSIKPLLVVGAGTYDPPRRVIAAVSLAMVEAEGALNDLVVREAKRLSSAVGADLHLAHVFQPMIDLPDDPAVLGVSATTPLVMNEIQEVHREQFARQCEHYGVPIDKCHLGVGPVEQTLTDLGDSLGADVIVAGNHDRRGFDRLLSGKLGEHLIANARQNVLVVKLKPID